MNKHNISKFSFTERLLSLKQKDSSHRNRNTPHIAAERLLIEAERLLTQLRKNSSFLVWHQNDPRNRPFVNTKPPYLLFSLYREGSLLSFQKNSPNSKAENINTYAFYCWLFLFHMDPYGLCQYFPIISVYSSIYTLVNQCE